MSIPTVIASNLGIAVKTVESHRERIKIKLQLRSGEDMKRRAVEWVISTAGAITRITSLFCYLLPTGYFPSTTS